MFSEAGFHKNKPAPTTNFLKDTISRPKIKLSLRKLTLPFNNGNLQFSPFPSFIKYF
jgi:hypothetical protein